MLRLALARPSRRALPALTRWSRFNSNRPLSHPDGTPESPRPKANNAPATPSPESSSRPNPNVVTSSNLPAAASDPSHLISSDTSASALPELHLPESVNDGVLEVPDFINAPNLTVKTLDPELGSFLKAKVVDDKVVPGSSAPGLAPSTSGSNVKLTHEKISYSFQTDDNSSADGLLPLKDMNADASTSDVDPELQKALAEMLSATDDLSVLLDEKSKEKPVDPRLRHEDDLDDDVTIDPALLSASIKDPPKMAENEAELFGLASPQEGETNPSSDPNSYPRPYSALGNDYTEAEYAGTLVHGRGIHMPYFHKRHYDIPVANIQFRSHYPRLLDLFTHFATHAASALGIPTSKVVCLPTKRTLWTVLKGPFVHKKKQENFERRVHKRAIKAWDADPEVVDRWTRYLRRHAMGGVGMRIVKWERMPLGVGHTRLAGVMEGLESGRPVANDAERIKQLGEEIVRREMATVGEEIVPHVEQKSE